MLIREKITVPPLTGDRERWAYVYLPVGYEESGESYPVMYMFDGHNLFSDEEATYGKSWGLSDYLDEHKTPLIIAAVECNHEGDGRLSEYSPVTFSFHSKKIVGRGKKYMDWLVGTFKPAIDSNFRTLKDRENTLIGGSSMGGLMAIYAAVKYQNYFKKAAALSPSLWVQDGAVPDFILKAKNLSGTEIFMDYGTREFKNHSPQQALFSEVFKILSDKGAGVTARVVPGGTHSEAFWESEVDHFIRTLGF